MLQACLGSPRCDAVGGRGAALGWTRRRGSVWGVNAAVYACRAFVCSNMFLQHVRTRVDGRSNYFWICTLSSTPDFGPRVRPSRSALGARRTALRAEGAARLCARRRSRWLPSPPRATRSAPRWRAAPGAWAPIRQPGRGLALRARHQRRRRCTPERPHVLPRLRTLSPGDGGDVKDVVRFALLETLGATRASRSCRGRGWGGVSDIIMRKCAGERLRATAACAV